MILSNLLKKYESFILKHIDKNNSLLEIYALLLAMLPFVIFNYILYHFILGFNNEYLHYGMLSLALPKGRLFIEYIRIKNNLFFNNGHNWFTFLLFVGVMITGIIGLTYLIIKDINGDFKKVPKAKIETIKYNNNFLNTTNKYDYLKNDNK